MDWFEKITGFKETNYADTQKNIWQENGKLFSKYCDKPLLAGKFSLQSLGALQNKVNFSAHKKTKISIKEIVSDVQELHQKKSSNNAVFQVASQFNALEMLGPNLTPENGVTIYKDDSTQGPSCAIAAGAGTILRNYLIKVGDQIGQTKNKQINMLSDLERAWFKNGKPLWHLRNGYLFCSKSQLIEIHNLLSNLSLQEYEDQKKLVNIGIQSNTKVTFNNSSNMVTQVFCSAVPIAYNSSEIKTEYWQKFAEFILEAMYEATVLSAIKNHQINQNNKLFLTLIGGGVFGNPQPWILNSIYEILQKYRSYPLEIYIVSFQKNNPELKPILDIGI